MHLAHETPPPTESKSREAENVANEISQKCTISQLDSVGGGFFGGPKIGGLAPG